MTRMIAVMALLSLAAAQDAAPKIGDAFPKLELKTVDGKDLKLADYVKADKNEGKVVVIAYWSYNCPAGKAAMKSFDKFAEWCKDKGVIFIGVASYDKDDADGTKSYVEENKVAYPVVFDDKADIAEKLGGKKITETYVLDKEGKLQYRGAFASGKPKERKWVAQEAAQALLDGKKVEKAETDPTG